MVKTGSETSGAADAAAAKVGDGRFAAAAAAIGQPLLIARHADNTLLFANAAARGALEPLLGGDPIGQPVTALLADDPEATACLREALRKDGGRVRDLTLRLGQGWIRLSIEPFDDGAVPCDMICWSDITIIKDAEAEFARSREAAEAANRAKSEFLSRMSHELRTPLNAIIGFAEMLVEQVFGPLGSDKYQEYARDISDSGRHLLLLINDLLDMAKIELGRYELNRRMVDAAAVVNGALRATHRAAEDKTVAVALDVPGGMPRVYADERAMRQVMVNLLSNAIKFTPSGGKVEVMARADATTLTVAVSDAGIGIAPEDIERILRPFERGRNIRSGVDSSAGLGLPLAKHLIEMHGGRLWIDSTPGVGTTVSFRMPRIPGSS
ncbi:MAG: HAMP domain-containing histidine kinase [Alphaproteobacteria bacterium]